MVDPSLLGELVRVLRDLGLSVTRVSVERMEITVSVPPPSTTPTTPLSFRGKQ